MGDNSQELMTLDYDLPTVIIEGDNGAKKDTVVNDGSTIDLREDSDNSNDNREKAVNAKVEDYKNGLSLSMREKSMISYRYASRIINTLRHETAGKKVGIDCKFHSWCRQCFKIDISSGVEITGHGDRDKMRHEINQYYFWIPSKVVDIFLSTCIACQVRKPLKSHIVSTSIVPIGSLTRLEIDLTGLRIRPDGDYKWILHCKDHFSKFSWAYPLRTKEAAHVAQNLSSLFYQFGLSWVIRILYQLNALFFLFSSKILQSDNGKEFTAGVIKDLKLIWPGLAIINGRPRHPQSQGLVERSNSTLCDILDKILQDRGADRWTECLPVAVYSMNTSLARDIKTTPFE
ncbi:unnamed protein product [Didymodactylos carnosus]|uniref:Integrase catalytic domain-containing protein n=1 Tax=Didymodactylos carnosus TaxID=1234261 RepID=A0A814MEM4_9BILA|nr:unnamed protein product [Didymodactylos carnosus]CAF3844550.1 unnamed protein product [Didymodactylos carnosus]